MDNQTLMRTLRYDIQLMNNDFLGISFIHSKHFAISNWLKPPAYSSKPGSKHV